MVLPWGCWLCVCSRGAAECPSARRHTQLAAAAPPPRRDSKQQLWALAPGESRDGWGGARSSPEHQDAVGSRAAVLESDCEHDGGCRAPEMYSQSCKGGGPESHWSLLRVMGGCVMVCAEQCDGTQAQLCYHLAGCP